MNDLARQHCFNHSQRTASARCPECTRFFCRECVTEHEGRVLCARCLEKRLTPGKGRRRLRPLLRTLQGVVGAWLIWLFFYYIAKILLHIPSAVHEGTIRPEGFL
jgi:hypothetical protein